MKRIAHLDSARALMLLLGIPFHASEIYRVSGGWHVASPDTSWTATLLGALVHVFRMPAFFLLSGFFAAMLLARRDDGPWLRDRARRLGVPLVCSLLGFGWLESAIGIAHAEGIALVDAIASAVSAGPARWSHHRWFLVVLLLYCASAVAVRRWVPGGVLVRTLEATRGGPWRTLGLAACLAFVPFAIAALAGPGGFGLDGGDPHDDFYLRYAAFFALGYALYRIDGGLDRFVAFDPADRALAAVSLPLYLVVHAGVEPGTPPEAAIVLVRLGVDLVAGLYATKLFFLASVRYLDVRTAPVRHLVDASLCIYLVHLVFVLVLGARFTAVALPPMLEIGIITVVTFALGAGVYEIVRRSAWLSMALNGR